METIHCIKTRALVRDPNVALLIRQIHYWLPKGETVEEGVRWIYKTHREWQEELFPEMSVQGVRSVVNRARKTGIIQVRRRQKTMLYRLNYDRLRQMFAESGIDLPAWVAPTEGVQLSADVEIAMSEAEEALTQPVSDSAPALSPIVPECHSDSAGALSPTNIDYAEITPENAAARLDELSIGRLCDDLNRTHGVTEFTPDVLSEFSGGTTRLWWDCHEYIIAESRKWEYSLLGFTKGVLRQRQADEWKKPETKRQRQLQRASRY